MTEGGENMKEKRRISKIIAIIVGIGLVSGIGWYITQITKVRPVNEIAFSPTLEMVKEYSQTYGKTVMKNEKKLLSENKDSIGKLKARAYFEGYRDFSVYEKKLGPQYDSDVFDGLSEKNSRLQKKLYKEMYKLGYQDAKDNFYESIRKFRDRQKSH